LGHFLELPQEFDRFSKPFLQLSDVLGSAGLEGERTPSPVEAKHCPQSKRRHQPGMQIVWDTSAKQAG
jgi:hypothetical protein